MRCTKVTISPDNALELIEEYKNELLNKDVPLRFHYVEFLQTLKLISEGTEIYIIDFKRN